jgi:mRNA interferase HigB
VAVEHDVDAVSVGGRYKTGVACAQIGYMLELLLRIIARRTLRQFVDSLDGQIDQKAVKGALDAWFDEVKRARWKNAVEVGRSYATASIVSSERIVFNIKGNAYRLVTAVDFQKGIVWIKWIGSHRDYDHVDVKEIEYARRTEANPQQRRLRKGDRRRRPPLGSKERNA